MRWPRAPRTAVLHQQSGSRQAVIEGAVLRVRPIAMTCAVILARAAAHHVGHGTGSEMMRRIAAPMLGGMITAPLLSMFVIPVLYGVLRTDRLLTEPSGS